MKFKNLEGLRGLAAFIVVIYHFLINFYPAIITADPSQVHTYNGIELKIAASPLNVIYNGSFSVYIFFVLSGFVLSYKYFKTGDSHVIAASAIRRYFRLMIPVLFSIIFVYFLYTMKFPWMVNNVPNFSFISALKEGLYGSLFKGINNYNPVLWTMRYEFFGSFLVFGFCLIFGGIRNRVWCYVLAVFIFWNTPYLAFILGMLISDVKNKCDFKVTNIYALIGLWFAALFLGSYPNVVKPNETLYSFLHVFNNPGIMCHTIGAAILLVAVLNSDKVSKVLSSSLFGFLGRISFSMYIIHATILVFLSHYIFDYFHLTLGLPYKYSFAITFPITMTTIFIISYLAEKYVDRNAVKFSGFVYNRFFKKSETVAVKVLTDRPIAHAQRLNI